MVYLLDVPSLDGSKRFFVNVDQIWTVMPHRNDTGKCTVTFSNEHSVGVGCEPFVLVDAVRRGDDRVP
ncbi:hypothetical protein DFP91_5875 [Pseudorhodoplanes sinuspersici]|nr:hypothetical protein DFP91_5875 [Pseudorhodoplanes sinuspersici]